MNTHLRPALRPGRLIVFEGLDGVGKSTLSKRVAAALGAEWRTTPGEGFRPVRHVVDGLLGGSPDARTAFYASTVLHEASVIGPVLRAGRSVVVDRWWASTQAYGVATGAASYPWAQVQHLVRADDTVLVTLDEDARRQRLEARGIVDANDRATLDPAFAERVCVSYQDCLRSALSGRAVVVDTTARTVDEVVADVVRRLIRPLQRVEFAPTRRWPTHLARLGTAA